MKLSLFSLILLIVAALDNTKNLPSIALLGSYLPFFFIAAALLFLLPTALVAAELSAAFPVKGGIYEWVKRAFGSTKALMAVWFQWINTMIWYPSMLSFIAATIGYVIDPHLVENKWYLVGTTLAIFWSLTWINLKGIQTSSRVINLCFLLGTLFPMVSLVGVGLFWVIQGHPLQIHFTRLEMIPSLTHPESWVTLVAIMASFLGIELSGVHVNDIDNPKRNFPKAILISIVFIFLSLGLTSLVIAAILPKGEINLLSGVMQVFQQIFHEMPWIPSIFALLIALGSIGTMVNWLIAPAKGLLQAAEDGYLPKLFLRKNRANVPSAILLGQAIIVSLISLLFLLPGSASGSFWLLTALSTELYMLMYIFMFSAGLKLHDSSGDPALFRLSTKGIWGWSILGLIGCSITIGVSFFPPSEGIIQNPLVYVLEALGCNVVALMPLVGLCLYKKKRALAA